MTTATLKREDDVRADTTATAKTFLGYYMPYAGVRYYAIFGEHDVGIGWTKIGPVGWRRHTPIPTTRPKVTWAA